MLFSSRNIIYLLIGICFISSCITTQPTVTETPNLADEYTDQQKAELSVKAYLKHVFDTIGTYSPYGFGKVVDVIPDQVTQLEELKSMRKLIPEMKDHYGNKLDSVILSYDSLIAQKEREIRDKKVRPFHKISHVYTVKLKSDSVLACEVEFTLDPNFKMYDAHSSIYIKLDLEQAKWFDFYYMQYPLFDTYVYEDDKKRSQEIYDFYDKKLMETKEDKSEVLVQVIYIIQHIKTTGEYSNQKIAEAVIKQKMNLLNGKTYQAGKFSTLKAIIKNSGSGNQHLIGYSIVHTFKTESENLLVEKALYFEFDPWLILAGYLPVNPPYEQYFEK